MKTVLQLSLLVCLVALPAPAAEHWPHLRGPALDGRLDAPGTFEGSNLGLSLAWKQPLGSAYSGIALADGRAVTMFSDGESDWVVALDARTGAELWRHRIDATYKGHDGSDDGPLSSPTIGGGAVYSLGPGGQLLALDLADGKPLWSRQLEQDFGAKPPHFGFTTMPLVEGDRLVLQTGGAEGRAISGLDRKTGETLWSYGDGETNYQSPSVMTLGGKRQVVAALGRTIVGIDPADGRLLWAHELGEEDRLNSANPTFVGDDRVLFYVSGQMVVFRVSKAADGFTVEERYRTAELGGSWAVPVYHDGYIYGFRRQFLTCIDAANGERVWRSRPPGGKGLILVDGKLVILAAEGNVVLAKPDPKGYEELARFKALDGSGLTWPSFADGRIYVRNLNEIAAVAVTEGAGVPALAEERTGDHAFGRWVAAVEAAEDGQARVERFLSEQKSFPILEGEFAHFVYRGDAQDVGIAGSWLDSDAARQMHRIDGTDLFHHSFRLEPATRWEYRFQVDFADWVADERNPRSVPGTEGEDVFSEFVTPGYEFASHTAEPSGERGRVDTLTLESEILGYAKEVRVWLPSGYDESEQTYRLLVVNDGEAWIDKGLMLHTLDNVVGKRVAPIVVAFVPPSEQWWLEAGGSRTGDYVKMQAEELLPALHERYRLADTAGTHAVLGNQFYAVSAAFAALSYPQLFGGAAMQSVYLDLGSGDDLAEMIDARKNREAQWYLDWNRFDARSVDADYDLGVQSRRLQSMLTKNGYRVQGGEMRDSHGWSGWRNRTAEMLALLFPKE